jgi:hypothetical protein
MAPNMRNNGTFDPDVEHGAEILIDDSRKGRSRARAVAAAAAVLLLVGAAAVLLTGSSSQQSASVEDVQSSRGTFCANEHGTCRCTGTIWYGKHNRWTSKSGRTGTTGCNNGVFGDPYGGTVKECRCEAATPKGTYCAREGGSCTCTGTIWYGKHNRWTKKTGRTGTTGCNNGVFGDPYGGTVKECRCDEAGAVEFYSGSSGNFKDNCARLNSGKAIGDIIHRYCPNCGSQHRNIYYKRLTPWPTSYDRGNRDACDLFTVTWSNRNNNLNTDFKLYSTLADARADRNAWRSCNYNDPNIGFPRDCGVSGHVGGQWNSKTRGGQANVVYTVIRGAGAPKKTYTPDGNGWITVINEARGAANGASFDNSDERTLNFPDLPSWTHSGNYQVRIEWDGANGAGASGAGWTQFTVPAGKNIFKQQADMHIGITGVTKSNTGNLAIGSSAKFCHACTKNGYRWGDTCWAVVPSNDNNRGCGCCSGG